MSTSESCGGPAKKMSSWVRPGVCEVRASALRPVSALIGLDLPTLDRPAKATSAPAMAGSTSIEPAAAVKRHSAANSRRPASISSSVYSVMAGDGPQPLFLAHDQDHALGLLLDEGGFEVVEEFDLGAVLVHNHRLLDDGQRVVPRPVDHQTGGEIRQHEGEDHRHPVE